MNKQFDFLATAIGSLPHTDYEKAVDLVFETISDAPLCPQLSKINPNEDMLNQYTEKFPAIRIDLETNKRYADLNSDEYFSELEELLMDYEEIISSDKLDSDIIDKYAISKDYYSGFEYFLKKLNQTKPKFVKGQIIGPFTFGTSTLDTEKRCTFYDETYREVITKTLTIKALWQIKEFKKASPNSQPIIFIDEPTMSQLGTSAYITVSKNDITEIINQITFALHKFGALVGMHCCGKTDWEFILKTNLDIINFDAFFFSENFSLYANTLKPFLTKGGIIAWGIVPTLDIEALTNTNISNLINIFENGKDLLVAKGINEQAILNASVFTPSCGAGSLNEKNAKLAMNYVKELSLNVKEKYKVS